MQSLLITALSAYIIVCLVLAYRQHRKDEPASDGFVAWLHANPQVHTWIVQILCLLDPPAEKK